ncbi:MAG: response regulator [Deltaproteobacteria bacterium]|nr:response regulator [Deltaproteobacteria bacterium]
MRVLLVENHDVFAQIVTERFLAGHDVTRVATLREARDLLASARFAVVLVDYDLDDAKGDELVRWLAAHAPDTRTIGISSRPDGNAALHAAGANAICAKQDFARIAELLDELDQ